MNILHFCSYFVGSKVYSKLFVELKKQKIHQRIIVPIRCSNLYYQNNENLEENILYIKCLNTLTRALYSFKLLSYFIFVFPKIKKTSNAVIHAHTLYSDGIPAYLYSLFFKSKELIITVRNTDVNLGFKFYPQYKWLAKRALRKSKKVVFISHQHLLKFQSYFGREFDKKLEVVPNGIDESFLRKTVRLPNKSTEGKSILFVGRIDKNKNVESLVKALYVLQEWQLKVVGGTYADYHAVHGTISVELRKRVDFLGKVQCKSELRRLYQSADVFAMASFSETFGLSYVESLSQGTPIVYTQGEGIDGYFEEGQCGYSCDPYSVVSIINAITQCKAKFPKGIDMRSHSFIKNFNWEYIAKNYLSSIYK
ncbi:glycosyltransferase family 4 protein [Thalassotalea agarivorans]|uniref:Glycosyltransferase involved in cell wall bisynthesis n=1 Tax=Thalassotalea agarivorans TaxID=349064 RepID=A0A1H9Y266_THASX|nr:glycosyltransferase family 4 protein [Thalassotalea agarivorans]SES62799.1 Glycosyltransferase involved in cell wall bisynthesis [Thalassotalea agarivorans]